MDADTPIVEEVRKRRHEISERFAHDLYAYAEHLKEIEEKHRDRVVSQVTVVARRNTDRPKPRE